MNFKRLLLLLVGGLMVFNLFGCGTKKYKVTYDYKNAYRGAQDSYAAGQEVTLYYDVIATDTIYTFYVDDKEVSASYLEKRGYVIAFTMPDRDVNVYVRTRNTMAVTVPIEVLLSYETGTSGIENGGRSTSYTLYWQGNILHLSVNRKNDGETETREVEVDSAIIGELRTVIEKNNFASWKNLKNAEAIDGGYKTLVSHIDGNTITANTGHMPSDGQEKLSEVEDILISYLPKTED